MKSEEIIKKAFGLYIEEKGAVGSHLTEETLALYLEDLLAGEEKDRMEEHLAGCPECLDLLLVLKEMESLPQEALSSQPLNSPWVEKLKELLSFQGLYIVVKSLKEKLEIPFTSGEILAPAFPPLGVRGAPPAPCSQLVTVQKHFGSLQVEVEVEQVSKGEKEVKVMLTNRWSKEPQKGMKVNLLRQDRLLSSYIAREGEVLFSHLNAGKYHIKIFDQQSLAGLIILDLKGESHEG